MKHAVLIILFFLLVPGPGRAREFGPFNTTLVRKESYARSPDRPLPSTASWVLNRFIRVFQVVLSPQDGPNCRYEPTCSRYAYLCINDYGPVIGTVMTADRYLRCNPFGAWGQDLPEDNYFFGRIK